MTDDLRLYTVTDEYVNYLNSFDSRVSLNKEDNRKFNRKYLGTVLKINEVSYFVPLASPKNSDYYIDDNGDKRMRKNIVPIIRIAYKERNDALSLLGTLKFNNMIPVIESEAQQYDLVKESNAEYQGLVFKQWDYIKKHKNEIFRNARTIYTQKIKGENIGYLNNTVDFTLLERKSREYKSHNEQGT